MTATTTAMNLRSEMEIRTASGIPNFDGFMAVQLVPVAVNDGKQK